MDRVAAGVPWSFGGLILCTLTAGAVTIDKVVGEDPTGGMTVRAFGTRPNPFVTGGAGLGAEPASLAGLDADFELDVRIVDSVCPGHAEQDQWQGGTELGVEVAKTTDGLGISRGLSIEYTDGAGRHGTLKIPFGLALCPVDRTCDETPDLQLVVPSG